MAKTKTKRSDELAAQLAENAAAIEAAAGDEADVATLKRERATLERHRKNALRSEAMALAAASSPKAIVS